MFVPLSVWSDGAVASGVAGTYVDGELELSDENPEGLLSAVLVMQSNYEKKSSLTYRMEALVVLVTTRSFLHAMAHRPCLWLVE